MLLVVKRIIQHMKELARRYATIFFSLFGVFAIGSLQAFIFLDNKLCQLSVSILLAVIALICLVIAIKTSAYDLKSTWRKEHSLDEYFSIGAHKRWWQWWKWRKK